MNRDHTHRYCGRIFTVEEIEKIRGLISSHPQDHRAQLSRLVCDELGWLRPDGRRRNTGPDRRASATMKKTGGAQRARAGAGVHDGPRAAGPRLRPARRAGPGAL